MNEEEIKTDKYFSKCPKCDFVIDVTWIHRKERQKTKEKVEKILNERRRQVNKAFEGKDERMLAHLHTFINQFENEFNEIFSEDENNSRDKIKEKKE